MLEKYSKIEFFPNFILYSYFLFNNKQVGAYNLYVASSQTRNRKYNGFFKVPFFWIYKIILDYIKILISFDLITCVNEEIKYNYMILYQKGLFLL